MIHRVVGHIEEKMEGNTQFLVLIINHWANTMKSGEELKIRLKQLMVVKNFSITKILSRLNLTQMMIYH